MHSPLKMKNYLIPYLFGLVALTAMAPVGQLFPVQALEEDQDPKPPVATYVGATACRKCHGDQHKDWKKTKMAKAFDVLKPGEREEAKVKAGLDPQKDYRRDETCLPCHTTGWGEPGGYQIPPEGDSSAAKKAQKAAKALEGVQCEACHGPSSLAIAYKKQHEEYRWEDLKKNKTLDGVLFPTEETCAKCHNDESPFVDKEYVFEFDKRKEEGTHKHLPMDFDHGCPHKHTPTQKKKKNKKT